MVAHGLTKRFGDLVAVDHLDLDVRRAEIYGFLGPNGCGKSTTIRMLCGLLRPSEGEVSVLGQALPRGAETVKRAIGYMTQKFSLYEDLSVRQNLEFLAAVHGLRGASARARLEEMYARYHLGELKERLAGTLSGGQKQRLALAGAVLHEPELLLLDEPTSAVDPQSRRDFWDALFDLAEAGTTLLVSTHYMDEAERCHRLAILDRGRLVADGSPQRLMADLPGSTFRVDCGQPRRVQLALAREAHVLGVAQIGSSLRVLTDRRDGADWLRERVRAIDADAEVEAVAANLEDVFVAATRKSAVEAAA
ncbi:ABC transporter ATP-binding protein [Dokdonella sp.]|uniref:ABC transporter ATP-binding protein n=1 Tax=Dokdonella sp. TaxID=2291710 RepID=UPI001B073548|nr:ABC transporter ATP-binding protein [Dokdonella sp.]MBO9662310.1 ABC transporter ATP-binding protein [Dokdonella sp.]